MSYKFIFYVTEIYAARYPDIEDDALIGFAIRVSTFLLYHEIADALIDAYHLPLISNEETAADNLAVILALEYTKDGYDIAMDSAELFDVLDETSESYKEEDFWDEHALDAQRFYNILCLTYGKYPDQVQQDLKRIKNKKLLRFIDEKRDFCKDEYDQILQGFSELLDPHMI